MTWIDPPSTGAADWRKWRQRIARQALCELWPNGPPLELTLQRLVDRVQSHCSAKGWPAPGERTIQRTINGR
jgi:hypothetical protein